MCSENEPKLRNAHFHSGNPKKSSQNSGVRPESSTPIHTSSVHVIITPRSFTGFPLFPPSFLEPKKGSWSPWTLIESVDVVDEMDIVDENRIYPARCAQGFRAGGESHLRPLRPQSPLHPHFRRIPRDPTAVSRFIRSAGAPDSDILDVARRQGGGHDMGAYEYAGR